jgi:hypothetical protein
MINMDPEDDEDSS